MTMIFNMNCVDSIRHISTIDTTTVKHKEKHFITLKSLSPLTKAKTTLILSDNQSKIRMKKLFTLHTYMRTQITKTTEAEN